ncbi:MAG: hypothetical protein QF921_03835 [Pseudomonadales bacterium]|nr:hypothetical protein [Pseudomonadales bacterium]MDP6970634.1 hypothetical protein [Pseudomonadales bacterium]
MATAIALATFIASCSTGHSSSAAYLHFAMAVVDPCWIETTVGEPREQPLPESYITAIRESGHLPLAA